MKTVIRVLLIEYERGWGSRIDEALYFKDVNKASAYVEDFNSKNTEKVVPDWYMIAEGPNIVQVKDDDFAKLKFEDAK